MTFDSLLDDAVRIATLVGVIVSLFKIKELHLTLNSRLDQLLVSEKAAGVAEERERAAGAVVERKAERKDQ